MLQRKLQEAEAEIASWWVWWQRQWQWCGGDVWEVDVSKGALLNLEQPAAPEVELLKAVEIQVPEVESLNLEQCVVPAVELPLGKQCVLPEAEQWNLEQRAVPEVEYTSSSECDLREEAMPKRRSMSFGACEICGERGCDCQELQKKKEVLEFMFLADDGLLELMDLGLEVLDTVPQFNDDLKLDPMVLRRTLAAELVMKEVAVKGKKKSELTSFLQWVVQKTQDAMQERQYEGG